jgi:hypothetical protein
VLKFVNIPLHHLLLVLFYRPPSAFVDSFATIEQIVKTIDNENKEFYILADLNANMLDTSSNSTNNVKSIMELY